MDLNALKDAAIEATTRALRDKYDVVPDEDSDEWEAEYRRQFVLAKQRYGEKAAIVTRPAVTAAVAERQYSALTGTPEQQRWAGQVRAERMNEIPSEPVRRFLAQTWTRSKVWIDTRDVPITVLLQRLRPQYDDWRKKQAEEQRARMAEAQQKAAAIAAHQEALRKAGITETGLVEMVDASERAYDAPLGEKLAEIGVDDRHLRVFASTDPNILLIKEKNDRGHTDYAIERDEGLVADLKLFAQSP
jgi:hypothetical protein